MINILGKLGQPSAQLSIALENEQLVMHDSPQDSAGCFLRGSLFLNCREPTYLRTLTLRFKGSLKVWIMEGSGAAFRSDRKAHDLIDHQWVFLAQQKRTHILVPGLHSFPFELALPGDLPESVDGDDLASVLYRLTAIAERPKFASNLVLMQDVPIVRHCYSSDSEFFQPMTIADEWTDKITYDITVPTRICVPGETIPTSIKLSPRAENISIHYVSAVLEETVTLRTSAVSKTSARNVVAIKNEQFPCEGTQWSNVEQLHTPQHTKIHPPSIAYDTENAHINITHVIHYVVCIKNPDGHFSELRATIPIIVSPVPANDELNQLPAYEDTWRSLPYDPALAAALSRSASALSLATTPSHPSSDDLLDTSFFSSSPGWPLSRVPSYDTAILSQPSPIGPCYGQPYHDGLPEYQSILVWTVHCMNLYI
ncbi:hypothetical protein BZG36_03601 [Bifiguratus adelaidae]|uniref:Arrestin C-terminal-like domain-containing protein n=1 Tax=Bifiguratus adelaidae TaxID=1938954 RepID=A0A261XYG9_9FUNG|nr:hypothetical protein BZG36_03601 [Bifiguratus adelaidae]